MCAPLVARLATSADSSAIAETIHDAFTEYRGVLVPESGALNETVDSISSELRGGSEAVLAERAREMLGCVMIKTMGSDMYLGRLAVRPAERGQGIGRLLVRFVEDLARQRDLEGVQLGVRVQLASNQEFFGSLGYLEISRSAHEGFSYPTSITMRRILR